MISTGEDFHQFGKLQNAICFSMYPFGGFVNPYRLTHNFLSPPNSDTRINDGKREQGFMNSLLIFSKFAPEGIQAPSPNRTTSNGENNES
jgi:hypothetical protein